MTELILRRLVRDVLTESDEADPGALADVVLERIPEAQVREALAQTLRLYVRQVISETRIGAGVPLPAPMGSVKVAAIRDGWQRRLHTPMHVGKGQWKLLAACNYDDLLFVAAERREHAERNAAWARVYDSWARLLTEYDVQTFGDLPVEEQAAALGSAA